jgi:putative thioredoxin
MFRRIRRNAARRFPEVFMLTDTPAAGQAPADDLIKDTTTTAFRQDVMQESMRQPVLVDFWAPWCGPCKQLTPVLEKAVRNAGGKVKLVKMNIDEHPQIAGQLGIQSIPAVIAFQRGQPVDGFMGALPEGQVKGFIERLVGPLGPTQAEDLMAEAEAAAEAGDVDAAPPEAAKSPAIASVRAKIELAEQAASLGDLGALQRQVEADPADHQARFDLALGLNARDRREDAVNHLVEIVRRDRGWNEDAARKQLLQLFEAWGPMDPMTIRGRRKLSSLMFS